MSQNRAMHSLVFSLIAAVFSMLLGVLLYNAGMFDSPLAYLSYAFLCAIIAFGQLHWRKTAKGGYMTYGHAFVYGLLLTIWYSVIMAIWTYVFMSFIAPDFIDMMLEKSRQNMEMQNLPEDQIDMAMEMTKKFMSPGIIASFSILVMVFFGVIFSLVTSAFTKKDRNPFDQMQDQMQQQYNNPK